MVIAKTGLRVIYFIETGDYIEPLVCHINIMT